MNAGKKLVLLCAAVLCLAVMSAGCSKKAGADKDKAAAAKKEPPRLDFGAMPKELCSKEDIKRITMDIIDNQVFISTDKENLWGGQTVESLTEMAKSMAEGFLSLVPDPQNCVVEQAAVECGEALSTLNKANGNAYKMDVMQKNMKELGVTECGRLSQEMDFMGTRAKTLYFVGKIKGRWTYIFNVSQMQIDAADKAEKDKAAPAGE